MACPALYLEGKYPYDVNEELESIEVIETMAGARSLVQRLNALGSLPVAVDTEADDIDPGEESPVGKGLVVSVQFSWIEEALYMSDSEVAEAVLKKEVEPTRVWVDTRNPKVLQILKPWLENSRRLKVLHNFDFDAHMFRNHGIELFGLVGDTLAMSRAQYPERMAHMLDGQGGLVVSIFKEKRLTTQQALNIFKTSAKDGRQLKTKFFPGMLYLVEDEEARPFQQVYSTFDVYDTIRLYYVLKEWMRQMEWDEDPDGFFGYYQVWLNPYLPVLHQMEREGICVDGEVVESLIEEYEKIVHDIEKELYEWVGVPINWNSSKQKSFLLYGDGEFTLNDSKRKTEITFAGKSLPCKELDDGEDVEQPSTDKEHLQYTLERLNALGLRDSDDYRAIKLLQELQTLQKLVSGTLYPLRRDARDRNANGLRGRLAANGRFYRYVHGGFSVKARTGRLAAAKPNLQNIPAKTRQGKRIRHAFTCEEDEVLLCADYSQLELRILSYYVWILFGDRVLADDLESGDLHQATADRLGIKRYEAKAVNFGIVYGITAYKLSNDLGISEEAAQHLLDEYFRMYPGVKKYVEWAKQYAHQTGSARTLRGRYRQLPMISSGKKWKVRAAERQAMNTPIQGSAQDIVQTAMLLLDKDPELKKYGFKMRIQVHDEIVATCKAERKEQALKRMLHIMSNAMPPDEMEGIRFKATGHWGKTWAEAKEGARFRCRGCCGSGETSTGNKCSHCDGEGVTKNFIREAA